MILSWHILPYTFWVSYEREEDLRSVRAVYICSTGLGVTSLIKQKINEELNNITIVAFASSIECARNDCYQRS